MQVGTFIKTPAPHVAELLGLAGFDFAVVDAEHGPFERASADLMMIGGRAAGLPLMTRVPDMAPSTLLWALDIGSAALIVPHVDTAAEAAELVRGARFRGGARGFSNSARYAGYGGLALAEASQAGDRTALFCQIESGAAVAEAAAIAATPGVAGLVVGRADLALSLSETRLDAAPVMEATRRTVAAAREAGREAVVVVGGVFDLPVFLEMGATMAVVGSDQSLLKVAAREAASEAKRRFAEVAGTKP